jgi:histidinol phosphatase-like enzyme
MDRELTLIGQLEQGIILKRYIIGDKIQDVEAGTASGCRTFLISHQGEILPNNGSPGRTWVVESLIQAVQQIIGVKELVAKN